jgi:uncharacterized repeat protein (TIGR01451 family)
MKSIHCLLRGIVALLLVFAAASPASAGEAASGALRLEVIAAPNLVVDSNIGTPNSQSPYGAYIGARIWNDGATDLTNVMVCIGNYNGGTNSTPGIYPSRAHAGLVGPLTNGTFAITHVVGSGGLEDATRYLGTIKAGQYVPVYWLTIYPLLDVNRKPVYNDPIDNNDDLWLQYDVWGTAQQAGVTRTASLTSKVTMRREISASANKIYPNTANQVPIAYQRMLDQYEPVWTNLMADGSVGTRIFTEGYWYELGCVGAGYDCNLDGLFDQDAWLQPVGNPALFDPAVFRLLRSYTMLVVELKGGGEQVTKEYDKLYYTGIPENNSVIGYVRYEFMPLLPSGQSQLTPYQEAASGQNEKFNADYGISPSGIFTSKTASATIGKTASVPVTYPGSNIGYTVVFTNTGLIGMGDPSNAMPLVVRDHIPTGTFYVAGSALASNVPPPGHPPYAVLFSTNNGASWLMSEPPVATNVTDIQWWLSQVLEPAATGVVRFTVQVDPAYQRQPWVVNTAGLSLGSTKPFAWASARTLIIGNNSITNFVFADDGTGNGTYANQLRDGAEPGLTNISVSLYYDGNANGLVDASDTFLATAATATNGYSAFTNLLDGRYVVRFNLSDTNIPFGYTLTTPELVAVNLDAAHLVGTPVSTNTIFGLAPVLTLTKTLTTTGPLYEGYPVSYRIVARNNLPGDGTGQARPMQYTVWARTIDTTNSGSTAEASWVNPSNLVSTAAPDGVYANGPMKGSPELVAATDFRMSTQPGAITNVQVLVPLMLVTNSSFDVADSLWVKILDRATPATPLYSTNILISALVNGTLMLDVTTNRAWTWSDFGTKYSIQLITDAKNAATAKDGVVDADAVGFLISSDHIGGSWTNLNTLDPVPQKDTFNINELRYVSAAPLPTSVTTNGTTGTIYWSNVGPLMPGASATSTVSFLALEPPGNISKLVTNTVAVTNATYMDGRPVNPASAQAVTNLLPTGEIGDFIWRDLNRNGVQDAGEGGLAYVKVVLQPPTNANAGAGLGVPVTNLTDRSGLYLFTGLTDTGRYVVTVLTSSLPNGGVGVTNTFTEMNGTSSPTNVTVVTNLFPTATNGTDKHHTADFGYVWSGAAIDGIVWNDYNRNGAAVPDAGEPPLTNVTVYLYSTSNPTVAIATNHTDASGYFLFAGNYSGSYYVSVVTNTGAMSNSTWMQTFDTDGLSTTDRVTVTTVDGATVHADFSYAQTGAYALGITVFYDWNGNGVQDAVDEGIANIPMLLYRDAGSNAIFTSGIDQFLATTNTDAQGHYVFTNYPSGSYFVIVNESAASFPPLAICTADPYGAKDGFSLAIVTNASRFDQNFGYQPYGLGQIGDTVWRDLNADGVQGGVGETGITNVTVRLYADMNQDNTYVLLATTNTDASGLYLFTGLPDGHYKVAVDIASPSLPRDVFNTRYVPTTATNILVTLSGGNTYLGADFGFGPQGAIGDTVYWDLNANGTQDWGENGITNVTLRLYRDVNQNELYDEGTDTLAETCTTGTNGMYLFTGLAAGRYVVVVDTNSAPLAGARLTAAPGLDGQPLTNAALQASNTQYGVSIQAGSSFMGVDYGFCPPGAIGVTVWIDSNGDGLRDTTEQGIPYVSLVLSNSTGYQVTAQTDADGYYGIGGTPDGTYWMRVNTNAAAGFPVGLTATYDPDGTNTPSYVTELIISSAHVVSIGGVARTNFDLLVNYGYQYLGPNQLSGTIGRDGAPQNGVLGTGPSGVSTDEVAYAGVKVDLSLWHDGNGNEAIDAGETTYIASTLTDANGDYLFPSLPGALGDGTNRYVVGLTAPYPNQMLTTTNGSTPALAVLIVTNTAGEIYSARQIVTIAAVVTNIDFAFKDLLLYDYGDLPDSYSTRLSASPAGAQHQLATTPNLYLGAGVGADADGQPSATATLDTLDDGVTLLPGIWKTGTNGLQLQVKVGAGSGWLVGYVDFNRNGSFLDAGEMPISQAVSATGGNNSTGLYTFVINVPTGSIVAGSTTTYYARFRLFPSAPEFPTLAFSGPADNGEVEDYRWDAGGLSGTLWMDLDANGVIGGGETRIAGARVFVDANSNGVWEASEPYASTDTNGWYGIGGLPAGSYRVTVDTNTLPEHVAEIYDPDSVLDNRTVVSLTNGQSVADVNFGYLYPARVYGYAFYDSNSNAVFDAGDQIVASMTVRLVLGGTQLVTTVTDASGFYQFPGLTQPGAYTIRFGVLPKPEALNRVEPPPTAEPASTNINRTRAVVDGTSVTSGVAVALGDGVLAQQPGEPINIGLISGTTAAAVLIRAYATADGVIVEFETIEEAGTNDMLLYLLRDGAWVEVGRCAAVGEGNHLYRFTVPGLAAGELCNLMVRDDEGQYHTAYNLIVGTFATQAVLMDKDGMWLTWTSLPDRTYDIYRADRLGGTWTLVKTVTAIGSRTTAFLSQMPDKPAGFYRIAIR